VPFKDKNKAIIDSFKGLTTQTRKISEIMQMSQKKLEKWFFSI
jgi:hypothetical protein